MRQQKSQCLVNIKNDRICNSEPTYIYSVNIVITSTNIRMSKIVELEGCLINRCLRIVEKLKLGVLIIVFTSNVALLKFDLKFPE